MKTKRKSAYLESLVLEDFLDSDHLGGVDELGRVDDAKRSIADYFGVRVLDLDLAVGAVAGGRHHRGHPAVAFAGKQQFAHARQSLSLQSALLNFLLALRGRVFVGIRGHKGTYSC